MGEAKRRAAEQSDMVWHHTSILRTNLIWMSGVIQVEGNSKGALHPAFGELFTDAALRRPMLDFPPLAWFSSDFSVPKCLQHYDVLGVDPRTGEPTRMSLGPSETAAYTMNRIALGFRSSDIPVVPWPQHRGYATGEGRELNETARDLGDDPDVWWVADQAVDAARMSAVRGSHSPMSSKMERNDAYLPHALAMVRLCREQPGVYVPPSWVGSPIHRALIKAGNIHKDCRQFDSLAAK